MRQTDQLPSASVNEVPGPRGYPFIGILPQLRKSHFLFFADMARQYGDIVHLPAGPRQFYLINRPDGVKRVLVDHHQNYCKGRRTEQNLKLLFGKGLITSEGSFWLRQRRLAQPAFHLQRLSSLVNVMVSETALLLQRWRSFTPLQEPLDVAQEMMRLTLRIVIKTILGLEQETDIEKVGQTSTSALEYITRRAYALWSPPVWIPTPRNLRFRKNVSILDQVVYQIIQQHRTSSREVADLLSMLLGACDEETEEQMSDHQLRDEVITMLVAGHETTANALSWTWYLLSQHHPVQACLLEELSRVLNGRNPLLEDLSRLVYTRMVIEESMRLYPPVALFFRTPLKEDEVCGYRIPAGVEVVLSPYAMHRHPAYWKRPDEFDPTNFSPKEVETRPEFAYFPFGGGPRRCIGNHFAMMEAQIILAMVAQSFRLQLVAGHPIEPKSAVTLRPRYGLPVTLHELK